MRFSPKTVGLSAAVITITIWTSFIVVARLMALKGLTPLDIVLCRIVGASLVLLPWGYLTVRKMRAQGRGAATWLGLSPLPWRLTALIGTVGGVGYAVLAYSAFVFAPAAHGSVLMPGMLPLTTAVFSVWLLGEHLSKGRMTGLAMILGGALLVGGVSLFKAAFGSDGPSQVWRGDVLFVCASTCWAFYAVTCRKHALGAVPATIAVIVFCAITFIPVYPLLVWAGVLHQQAGHRSVERDFVPYRLAGRRFGGDLGHHLYQDDPVLWPGPQHHAHGGGAGFVGAGRGGFLDEPLYWNLLAGLALVTLGIVVGVRASSKPGTPPGARCTDPVKAKAYSLFRAATLPLLA